MRVTRLGFPLKSQSHKSSESSVLSTTDRLIRIFATMNLDAKLHAQQ